MMFTDNVAISSDDTERNITHSKGRKHISASLLFNRKESGKVYIFLSIPTILHYVNLYTSHHSTERQLVSKRVTAECDGQSHDVDENQGYEDLRPGTSKQFSTPKSVEPLVSTLLL